MKTKRLTTIPVDVLWSYRELKWDEVPAASTARDGYDVDEFVEHIMSHGIEPLELSIIGSKALLTDGENRLAAARLLGYHEVPVNVTIFMGESRRRYNRMIDSFKSINRDLEVWLKRIFLEV